MNLLIMVDGNRRWAKKKGLSFAQGYKQLPIVIGKIIDHLITKGEKKLYIHTNTINNIIKRPKDQVKSFLDNYLLIRKHIKSSVKVNIHVKGNLNAFKKFGFVEYYSKYKDLARNNVKNPQFDVYYFTNYSTTEDRRQAISKVKKKVDMHSIKIDELDKLILGNMEEPNDIDVILRTGCVKGRRHLSGFCPMKSIYAELMLVPELFPDLKMDRIDETIDLSSKIVKGTGDY